MRQIRVSPILSKNSNLSYSVRRRDRFKALLWQGDGFLLLYKRFEKGRLQWPRTPDEVRELTPQQYRWLMEGLSVEQPRAVQKIAPKTVL